MTRKKYKISVNNKMKGAMGRMDPDTNKIEINMRKHYKQGKLDRPELASTIKHELMHVNRPKATEKEVYKATAKTKIAPSEQTKLIAKLKTKPSNYKIGALKRRLNIAPSDKVEPGTFISKANDIKAMSPRKRTAFMGMV